MSPREVQKVASEQGFVNPNPFFVQPYLQG